MLTQTADHALRAILTIARNAGDRPMRVEEIAERTGAPRNYLGKTLNVLVKDGLLRSARGPLGGFALAMPADAITVGRIADLFSEARAPRRCLLGNGLCDAAHPCGAHRRWSATTAAARAPLDHTTIADLLSDATDGESPFAATEAAFDAGVAAGIL
ncbi:MAG TPA: Rrf2 family transcriptional regulator [Gemmatimonadaceae bacterium]|nr:Rrf2 family transcriptional regulator [Gemmatimonadaceae bacterium]